MRNYMKLLLTLWPGRVEEGRIMSLPLSSYGQNDKVVCAPEVEVETEGIFVAHKGSFGHEKMRCK